ncbi:MAG: patatin-like phospholipase family protein [Bacteroidales bacterium]|jgi:NTE family protein|nr:patatin-like phospholipase family protein [Bacteroidales bacterium]
MPAKNIENAKVHLVLGSGGARGIAHIGVINELKRLNCEIVSVSGCSMGAVVGGIYCTGKLDQFTEWLLTLRKKDVLSLMDFTLSSAGLMKGKKILQVIEDLIGTYNIEELDIPFTAVATDLSNRKEVHYETGNLYKAIRASIGIPTIFTPLIDGDKLLIDGGIVNPVPLSIVKKNSDDEIVIAVNLCAKLKTNPFRMKKNEPLINTKYFGFYKNTKNVISSDWLKRNDIEPQLEVPNVISVLSQSIDLMQEQIIHETVNAYKPDVLVNIRRDFVRTMDFHLGDKLIKEGVRAFTDALSTTDINENEKED